MMDMPSGAEIPRRAVEAALLILIEKRLGSTRVARVRHLVGSDQQARPAGQSCDTGQKLSPHALSSHSGTNFSCQYFSTHWRSCSELSYCSGANFSLATSRSKSEGLDGAGAISPCDQLRCLLVEAM